MMKLFVALLPAVSAVFSLHYVAKSHHPAVVGEEAKFLHAPNALQVADIYSRVSGLAPLLREGLFCYMFSFKS
jgi:hypothetical protein